MAKTHDAANPLPEVELFTDGACSGNPGPGGWAFILKHPASSKVLEQSGGEPDTTNNRMELTAAVRGLETLKKPSHVKLMTIGQKHTCVRGGAVQGGQHRAHGR